jgi:hypothetical protein
MTETWDVIVAGGGSAGVAAAVGAARACARTLLLERHGFLGGTATAAGVLSYCGLYAQGEAPRPVVAGPAAELLAGLRTLGHPTAPRRSSTGNWVVGLEPESLKLALDRLVAAAGAAVALQATVVEATPAPDGAAHAVRIVTAEGPRSLRARCLVDATGDGVLARALGALHSPTAYRQPGSLAIRIGGVAPDAALNASVFAAAVAEAGVPPDAHAALRAEGGFSFRLAGRDEVWWLGIDVTTDDLTRAEQRGRELAWALVRALRVTGGAGWARAFLAGTGPQVGIRESFHAITRDQVTEADCLAGRRRDDGIARGGWPIEVHEGLGRARYAAIGGEGSFDIPLGALIARDVPRLFVAGRLIGADAAAYGSLRVMGTAFATGHAAGIAAALAASTGRIEDVRKELQRQDAIL